VSLKLRCQQGFTTVTLMGILGVTGLLVAAGFAAVDPDISLSREDQDYKQAYGAAESGLQWYLNRLGQDNSFYVRCTNVPRPNATEFAPVNQRWTGAGADPRVWRSLPGSAAQYSVELVPAAGYAACIENNQYSMIDASGNMQLRVTGRSRGAYRTVRATLRRLNFIDFIYFTHFETLDPAAYSSNSGWAETNCSFPRAQRSGSCTEIQFAPTDFVRGPLHTNDNIRVCESPTFGRTRRDAIEIVGTPAYVAAGGCGASPNFQGTLVHPAAQLGMPPSNAAISTVAAANYHWYGNTRIALNGGTMTVTGRRQLSTNPVTTVTVPLPANGVIYVHSTSCAGGYLRQQTYTSTPSGCGNAEVHGTYGADLTIAAENDVLIDGDLTRGSDGLLLGLIANNFVRIKHQVQFGSGPGGCANAAGATIVNTIDAAILALNHSFIVDNWYCGDPTGDLNVLGAIAQRFRGPVGTGGDDGIATGYRKEYVYNDRLRYREPPYFLDPVQASWRIARLTEQVPAVKPAGSG
jgi:Tfp pilus assembly protein PilX